MPLSELLHRLTKGKLDSSQDMNPTTSNDSSFVPENDFVELVWDNGQIQSSRARKVQCNNLPSQVPNIRDKDFGNGTNTKMGKFGAVEAVLNEIPMPVPSVEMGLSQDDEMVHWLNYPMNESLQNDYCSEFLPELSGVTVNEHTENSFPTFDKRNSGNQSARDSNTVSVHNGFNLGQGNVPNASSAGNGEVNRPRTGASQLCPSISQQCQTPFPYFRSRISANNDDSISNTGNHTLPADGKKIHPTPGVGFPSIKMQKQDPVLPTTNSGIMNFSHFSRPAALVKANLQNIGARAGSRTPNIERIGNTNKVSTTSSINPSESTLIDPCCSLRNETNPIAGLSKVDASLLDAKPGREHGPAELPLAVTQEDDPKNDKSSCQNFGESTNKGFADGEKTIEPVVASSSVCSGNSVERPSDDPAQNLKRKNRDTEESEGPSEDVEEESVGAKQVAPNRVGSGSKRSRAAEVHNLSERVSKAIYIKVVLRSHLSVFGTLCFFYPHDILVGCYIHVDKKRRRDRINEKMRALQELIPNCNKVDKASMLDEAIEYLKTLQLQVQIMSMGSSMYMPSMMLPPGMPHFHGAHMPQFSPMSIGMGMGFGMGIPDMNGGSSGCSMIQVPPMHGAHYPGPPMSGPSAFHGMGGHNLQMFGLSGQGLPMAYPRAPLMQMPGGPILKTTMGSNASVLACPLENVDSAPASSSKDSIQNINSQKMQNHSAHNSMNQTTSQCQTANERFEHSALMQSNTHASEVTESGALQKANAIDNDSIRPAGCD